MSRFGIVTEIPGEKASGEQMERLFHRYHFARGFCEGRSVLEVGCGAGIGLGYLAGAACRVFGGDIDPEILSVARAHYRGRQGVECAILDAEHLPFGDGSFDVVLLFETIYYLSTPALFLREARRVLRRGGCLILCTVNRDWCDFSASPLSRRYFSIPELSALLAGQFHAFAFYGAFSGVGGSPRERSISMIRRCAISLGLMPKTMRGKIFFKRLFFGRLIRIPPEIRADGTRYLPPKTIPKDQANREYKILYAVARTASVPVSDEGSWEAV
jgi:SAM-dependent methyltransferase